MTNVKPSRLYSISGTSEQNTCKRIYGKDFPRITSPLERPSVSILCVIPTGTITSPRSLYPGPLADGVEETGTLVGGESDPTQL